MPHPSRTVPALFMGFMLLFSVVSISFSISTPAPADALIAGACNCVVFRLDDIQDWWLNSVQIALLNEFIDRDVDLSLGLVMNFLGNDASVVNKVREGHSTGVFELVSHGWNHVNYQGLTLEQQKTTLGDSSTKMETLWGRGTKIFIPPFNSYNENTLQATNEIGMQIISSEFDQEIASVFPNPGNPDSPNNKIFKAIPGSDIKDQHDMYHLPQEVGFFNYAFEPPIKNPLAYIENHINSRINNYGYAVVTLHPQDFTVKDANGQWTNQLDPNEINDLHLLIDWIEAQGYPIKDFSSVANIPLPPINDNTPPIIIPPPDKAIVSTLTLTPVSLGNPTVTDNVDPSPNVTNNAPSAGFPQGLTLVNWTATDDAGNIAKAVQYIMIRPSNDAVRPVISATTPPDGAVINGPAGGINIMLTGTASDTDSGVKNVEIRADNVTYKLATPTTPGSWSSWSGFVTVTTSGSNNLVAKVQDYWGLLQWDVVPVTVNLNGPDTTAPIVTPPADIAAEADGPLTIISIGTGTVFDNSDPDPNLTHDSPGAAESVGFPLGTTTVNWIGTDESGNSSSEAQHVTIVDTTPPGTPDLITPQDSTTLHDASPTLTWTGETDLVSSVTYDLQISSDPGFASPLLTQNGIVGLSFTPATDLSDGNYFWRVRSSDASGNTSPYSVAFQFGVDNTAPTVTAAPLGGAYSSSQSVALTASEPATIYYTTDGSTPTTSSAAYSSPISIDTSTLLKFFAEDTSMLRSPISNQTYIIDTEAPTVLATPTGGIYGNPQSVTLTASQEGSTIYFTTDGSTPTEGSPVYNSPIDVSSNLTLKFFAKDPVGNIGTVKTENYVFDTVAPTVSAQPPGGIYNGTQTVTLTASEQATIHFTTDGSTPTQSSMAYTEPIAVTEGELKFFGVDPAGNIGAVTTETYTIDTIAPTVTASPPGGIYGASVTVTLTASEPATIHYTTDGSTPTQQSAAYNSPIQMQPNTDLKFFAVDPAGNVGAIKTETYLVDTTAPTVTATPTGGLYNETQSVVLVSNEPATIYYTTDGSTPTEGSASYASPISIASSTTLKFFAVDTQDNLGEIATETYTIDLAAPTVSAEPPGGSYDTHQTVVLTASEPGATIHFTTDGSDPTMSSTVYSQPINIASNKVIKFFAVDPAGNAGSIAAETYTFDNTLPTVLAQPAGALYNQTQSVTLTASKPESIIYYTIDGSTPTTSSAIFAGPIAISENTMLKFFAVDDLGNVGTVATETYVIDTFAPTVSAAPGGGTYGSTQSVVLTASEPATIYYTTDESTPTPASQVYSTPISISNTTVLTFFARDEAGNSGPAVIESYSFGGAGPTVTATPAGGLYNASLSITLVASDPDSTIYFTTNGTVPTTASSVYSSPISVPETTELQFFGLDDLGNSGQISTENYVIDMVPPVVTAEPQGGVYNSQQDVVLTSNENSTIHYTVDGSMPTTFSAVYDVPIVISSDTDLKFFAVDDAGNSGPVVTESYVLDSASPTVTAAPAGGIYNATQSVTLTASKPASTIYFTTDGSTPTNSSAVYSEPVVISQTADLKFFAVDSLGNTGSVVTESYVLDTVAPTVTASPSGGLYNATQLVTLTSDKPSSTIYYTTDGSIPDISSQTYSTPITISITSDLSFFAVDGVGNTGSVATETYTIDTVAPNVTAVPAGGTFNLPQSVELGASETAVIYYTTDGSVPTTSSPVYASALSLSENTDLKFFAVDSAGNAGAIVTESYIFDLTGPAVSATPAGGTFSSQQSVTLAASEPATIYYTLDGSTPTNSSAVYSEPVVISQTVDLKFFGVDGLANASPVITESYVIDAVAPTVTASPSGGLYNATQSVTLTASKPASTIYFTTDGSTPTNSSAVYSSPISIVQSTDLKFFAVDSLGNTGSVVTESYVLDTVAPSIAASPSGGTYASSQSVVLTPSETATIYYTLDGSAPTTASPVYTASIPITVSTTLKYIGKDAAGNTSPIGTEVYTIEATSFPIIHMSDTTATFGIATYSSSPAHVEFVSPSSQLIGKSIDEITVKLRKGGALTGVVEVGIFNADLSVKKLFGTIAANTVASSYTDYTFSLPNNELYGIQSGDRIGIKYTGGSAGNFVAIMLDQNVADPFDGTNSYRQVYTTSWTSSTPNDLYMILRQTHGNTDTIPPTVTAFPAGGGYNQPQSVTLTADEPATIYYTLDGSTPTASSSVYSSAISISDTTTLKFFGQDSAGNTSPVQTHIYTIQPESFPATHMSDTTATYGLVTHTTQPAHVEFVSPSSQLIGKSIDEITVKLRRAGATPGVVEVGIFNADLSVKKLFGTIAANTVASSYTDYVFTLANNELYTIEANDRIGIKYAEGNSSIFIAVMIDNNPADPFDGTMTYRQQYNTSWSNYQSADLYMILKQTHS